MIDIKSGGNRGGSGYEGRGSEGTLSFVPLLPPHKCKMELVANNDRVWEILNFNLLAPFSMEMWRILSSVMDEEIEECKKQALLTNSPTKRILPRTWAMQLFSVGMHDCRETVIVRTKLDMEMGLKQ